MLPCRPELAQELRPLFAKKLLQGTGLPMVKLAHTAAGLAIKPRTSPDDALARVKIAGGVGEWTAQDIALRTLRFPDAFPAGDLGMQLVTGTCRRRQASSVIVSPSPGPASICCSA